MTDKRIVVVLLDEFADWEHGLFAAAAIGSSGWEAADAPDLGAVIRPALSSGGPMISAEHGDD